MEKQIIDDKTIRFTLNENDIDSAIRQFICACYPEFAIGHLANPVRMPKLEIEYDVIKE